MRQKSNEVTYYNIHNLVHLKIIRSEGKENPFLSYIDPLNYFKNNNEQVKNDIIIEYKQFQSDLSDCYCVDHKHYIKRNYIYSTGSIGNVSTYKIELTGIENGPLHLKLEYKPKGFYKLLHINYQSEFFLTRQLIRLCLLKQGHDLVHAGAVSKDDSAILLYGRGGALKTTLIMYLINYFNYEFLGDDTVILTKYNQVYSFPIYKELFFYRLNFKNDENLNNYDRIKFIFSDRLSEMDELKIINSSKLKKSIGCIYGDFQKTEVKEVSSYENNVYLKNVSDIEEFLSINIGFTDTFPMIIEAYNYIFPKNNLKLIYENKFQNIGLEKNYLLYINKINNKEQAINLSEKIIACL